LGSHVQNRKLLKAYQVGNGVSKQVSKIVEEYYAIGGRYTLSNEFC
jgi:hypothetical protein